MITLEVVLSNPMGEKYINRASAQRLIIESSQLPVSAALHMTEHLKAE